MMRQVWLILALVDGYASRVLTLVVTITFVGLFQILMLKSEGIYGVLKLLKVQISVSLRQGYVILMVFVQSLFISEDGIIDIPARCY